MRLIPVLLVLAILLVLAVPGLMAAATDPIRDLAEAVAYWQEQAIVAAVERDRAREELARVTAERDNLLTDRATLEEIVTRLQGERNGALDNAKAEAALRQQAERDLDIAISTIKSLQEALTKLAGPRFGLIVGATYDIRAGDPGLMAALQFSFK
jgi:competence protein ComGC